MGHMAFIKSGGCSLSIAVYLTTIVELSGVVDDINARLRRGERP